MVNKKAVLSDAPQGHSEDLLQMALLVSRPPMSAISLVTFLARSIYLSVLLAGGATTSLVSPFPPESPLFTLA